MFCAGFMGCNKAVVTNTVYRDVNVPVRCNVTVPPRPEYNPNPVLGVVDLLEYVEKLEVLLHTCTDKTTTKDITELEKAAKESTAKVLKGGWR
jgi:hypothetical protein